MISVNVEDSWADSPVALYPALRLVGYEFEPGRCDIPRTLSSSNDKFDTVP